MDTATRAQLRGIASRYLADQAGGHRLDHVLRVVRMAMALAEHYPAIDQDALEAAGWLHDIGRGIERREGCSHAKASAKLAKDLLPALGFAPPRVPLICQAIADHRYSAGIMPESLEGKLLQDADRLDALGAIGIARTFAESSERPLYHTDDPFAETRTLDDNLYAIDHFYLKLLKLAETMHTPEARQIAERRTAYLRAFLDELRGELSQ